MVIVLHGLEGCSRSGYVVEACRQLLRRGMRPLALNFRGRSGVPNRRRRLYHSGETDDLAYLIRRVRERSRDGVPVAALGFSLGGNVLLKYLGERNASETGLAAAAAVSVPFDLGASADHLERGPGRIYARSLLRSLKRSLRKKARRMPDAYDLERAERADTLRAFDDAVTAPVHGFRDAEEYYRLSSSARYLSGIDVDTAVIHAKDDPFVPADSVPADALRSNPSLRPHLCQRGGHVGFLASDRGGGIRFWAEERAANFLADRPETGPGS
ncbi:MAG: alpha/beta fold hydrolase [Candidatus Palauibacterales bacterium]|nr:alpha/beta fold hydrolase [Candidatus Palauibacterales bacterium]